MVTRKFVARFAIAMTLAAVNVASARAETGFIPLTDLGTGLYLGQYQGGLYPGGSNDVPGAHAAVGLTGAGAIVPRDTLGNPSTTGKYALISIGMSNTTQEFCSGNGVECKSFSFMGQAADNTSVNHDALALVNGARSGQTAGTWASPADANYDRVLNETLIPLGLSENQVQAAWVKVANPRPVSSLPAADADATILVQQMGDIARALKVRYPNMQQIFFSSRIYAGYATGILNPEPYAYESGFAVKRVIEAQIDQMNGDGVDPLAGDLSYESGIAPWIAWGPYLWADGLNPRSDGLIWERDELGSDGTHPSMLGEEKVGNMLMDFFSESQFTRSWFLNNLPGDFDGNRVVDAADLSVWKTGFGTAGSPTTLQGDADADQDVDGADFLVWQQQLGSGAPAGIAAVPEPTAWILVIAEALLLLLRRGRVRPLGKWHRQYALQAVGQAGRAALG